MDREAAGVTTAARRLLFAGVALFGLFAIALGARTLVNMRTALAPGVLYDLRLHVSAPVPETAAAAGVALDDAITTLDGARLTDAWDLRDRLAILEPGTPVKLGLSHGDAVYAVDLAAFRPDWPTAWMRFATGAILVLSGIGVFWFHPGRREAWPFLFACVTYGATMLTAFAMPRTSATWFDGRIAIFAGATIGVAFVHLFAVFPRPLRSIARGPRLVLGLDALGLAIGLAGALSVPYPAPLAICLRAAVALNAAAVIAIIWIAVWRLRRPMSRDDAARLRALLLASVLAFPIPAGLALVQAFHWWTAHTVLTFWISSASALCFPGIVGYAIARRDLFELDRAIARTAATSAIVGALALAFGAIAVLVPGLVAPSGSPVVVAAAVAGALALLWPVKRAVQRRLVVRFAALDLEQRLGPAREALAALAEAPEPARFGKFERQLATALDLAETALYVVEGARLHRPSTAERVDGPASAHAIGLALGGKRVGVLGLGRTRERVEVAYRAAHALEALAHAAARAVAERPPAQLAGYRIERFLAAGGMGNVYLGARIGAAGFVKPVAIKQLLPEMAVDPRAVERFLGEARLVARFTHPGIVQTLELGETEGGYFIVMEYVDGLDVASLARRLKRAGVQLPLAIAAHIVTTACLALDYAHNARDDHGAPLRLIHHDVSPHNLLVDGDGNVKLADFGVAHVRHDPSSRGLLVGKVPYLAPEQIRGDVLDHRVDVFAAGIVLYELVTGQHPFMRGTDEATLRAIASGRTVPPETCRDDCSLELALVIDHALAPRPDDRFASAAELAQAIQRVVPLDSRHAADLGRLVRSVRGSAPAAVAIDDNEVRPPTVSRPTVPG